MPDGNGSPGDVSLSDLRQAANSSAQKAATLTLTFLGIVVYLVIALQSVTDAQILTGAALSLPIIDTEVPVLFLGWLGPLLLLLLHANLLVRHYFLANRLYRVRDKIEKAVPSERQGDQKLLLLPYPLNNIIIGQDEDRFNRIAHSVVFWFAVILPGPFVLLFFQIRFVALQDSLLTGFHRGLIVLDILLIMAFIATSMLPERSPVKWFAATPAGRAFDWLHKKLESMAAGKYGSGIAKTAKVPRRWVVMLIVGILMTTWAVSVLHEGIDLGSAWFFVLTGMLILLPLASGAIFRLIAIAYKAFAWLRGSRPGPWGETIEPGPAPGRWSAPLGASAFVFLSLSWFVVIGHDGPTEQILTQILPRWHVVSRNYCDPWAENGVEGCEEDPYDRPLSRVRGTRLWMTLFLFDHRDAPFRRHLRLRNRILLNGTVEEGQIHKIQEGDDLLHVRLIQLHGPLDHRNSNFRGANLSGTSFRQAQLTGANFSGAELSGIDFRNTTLRFSTFHPHWLDVWQHLNGNWDQATRLNDKHCEPPDDDAFSPGRSSFESDGVRLSLGGARIEGANFANSDLRFTDFSTVSGEITDTIFAGSDVSYSNFARQGLRRVNFYCATLRHANLEGAIFRDTDLRGADLRGADLRGADLHGADLQGADLRGADLRFSILSSSIIPMICGDDPPTGVQLDGAIILMTPEQNNQRNIGTCSGQETAPARVRMVDPEEDFFRIVLGFYNEAITDQDNKEDLQQALGLVQQHLRDWARGEFMLPWNVGPEDFRDAARNHRLENCTEDTPFAFSYLCAALDDPRFTVEENNRGRAPRARSATARQETAATKN